MCNLPPKNISFPFSNCSIVLIVALTVVKYIWLQSSSVILNSTELLRLVDPESSVLRIAIPLLYSIASGD